MIKANNRGEIIMFGLVASLTEKAVCAPAAAFTSGVVIGKKLGKTIKG